MGIIGSISALLLVVVGGYQGTKWLVKVGTKVENRRRAAANLAGVLRSYGLVKTPEFLVDYSVGDYSGMGDKLVRLAELFLSGEAEVVKEFEQVFERCLVAKLATEQGRAYITSKLTDSEYVVAPA